MQTQRKVLPGEANAHRATDSHKHHVGTDLEAPVVWLLLRGENKETEGGGGRDKREKKEVRHFLYS